jgi:CheY-like chemotaxis protein
MSAATPLVSPLVGVPTTASYSKLFPVSEPPPRFGPREMRSMPIKILLVDDDEAFRVVTAIALESEGCEVQEAASGFAALEALQATRPDVIISDLDMPGLNGLELCRSVRANPGLAHVHFVLLSALIEPDGSGLPIPHEAAPEVDCCLSKQTHFSKLYHCVASLALSTPPHRQ